MNVYDFDQTIYHGDSTGDFIGYCIRKYPKVLVTLPYTMWSFLLYVIGKLDKTRFKERMYRFLKYVPIGAEECFWDEHIEKIKPWYIEQHKDDDIVISASPEFLVKPACERLGIKTVMATKVDRGDGKTDGLNCHDTEKVRRLYEWDKDAKINEFYSDSFADEPLAELANKAFMVRGDKRIKWDEYKPSKIQSLLKMLFSREFLMFLIVGVINTGANVIFSAIYRLFIPSTTLAFLPGYITSNVVSYLLNSKLTFKESFGFVKFVKFFISYLPNFFIQTAVVWLFDTFTTAPSVLAYALAAVIGVPLTFIFMKIFTFRKRQ